MFFFGNLGSYMVISAILLSVVISVVGLVLTSSIGILNKVRNQSSADLAVVSGSSACISYFKNGASAVEASSYGLTSGQAFFDQNISAHGSSSTLENSNLKNVRECDYRLEHASSTDVFLDPLNSKKINKLTANVLAESSTSITNNGSPENSSEVVFIFDDSYSMMLKLKDTGEIAANALSAAVNASYDTLFDGLDAEKAKRFAASQLAYSQDITFELSEEVTGTAGGFTKDKSVIKTNFDTNYKGGEDSTNIAEGISLGIEKIDIGGPERIESNHNEVLVLMSDGVPNVRTTGKIVKHEHPFYTSTEMICDGTIEKIPVTSTDIPIYKDDILIGYETITAGGGEFCNGTKKNIVKKKPNPNAGKKTIKKTFEEITSSAELLAERDHIIKICEDYMESTMDTNASRYIFSVFFETDNKNIEIGKEIMRKCASSAENFYYARNKTELIAAYQEIASKLLNLNPQYQPVRIVK